MATIIDEEYYMEMTTDFDYEVMKGIVMSCLQTGSQWENIVSQYDRDGKTIWFNEAGMYPTKCLQFITEVSKKLDSLAESTDEHRERLMNVNFEVTVCQEDCYGCEQYRVKRKNGKVTVLAGSMANLVSLDTGKFEDREEFLEEMENKFLILDDNRPIDVICNEIWPDGQDNPYWEYWENTDEEVYIHGEPETEWRELGDLYQIEHHDTRQVFDADDMIIEAMDKAGIPHDENTLEGLSVQDAYDILAGTYDKENSKTRPTKDTLKGKNFVLSTFHSSRNKEDAEWVIRLVNGNLQNEIGMDTDFVVYNEKLEDKGDNYCLALELNKLGRNIYLISLTDLKHTVLL